MAVPEGTRVLLCSTARALRTEACPLRRSTRVREQHMAGGMAACRPSLAAPPPSRTRWPTRSRGEGCVTRSSGGVRRQTGGKGSLHSLSAGLLSRCRPSAERSSTHAKSWTQLLSLARPQEIEALSPWASAVCSPERLRFWLTHPSRAGVYARPCGRHGRLIAGV